MNDEVTYSDFAKLAHQRHWTIESHAARFRGKIDEPREFFSRVLKASGAALLPYRSVIDFYEAGLNIFPRSPQLTTVRLGCKQEVLDRKKWALAGCRKRVARKKVSEREMRPCYVVKVLRLNQDKQETRYLRYKTA